jgi:hypothetical protein
VFDNLMVRHWDTWNCYAKRNHLFLCPLNVTPESSLSAATEDLMDIMFGLHTDCPAKPFGGAEEYNVCPDGRNITFASRRWVPGSGLQPPDMAWSTEVSIYTTSLSEVLELGTRSRTADGIVQDAHLHMVSEADNHGAHTSPSFSPDGAKIAYLAMRHAQYESDQLVVYVYDIATKTRSKVTADVDLSFGSLLWDSNHAGGESTYAIVTSAQHHGANKLFRVTLTASSDGSVAMNGLFVFPGCETRSCPMLVSTQGQHQHRSLRAMYFMEGSLSAPNMLKMVDDDVFEPMEVASVHDGFEAGLKPLETQFMRGVREIFCPCPEYFNGDITMPKVTQYYFPSRMADGSLNAGDLCHMFYLPPVGLQSEEMEATAAPASVPLILIVHGGPQSAFLNSWNYRWNLAFYASKGTNRDVVIAMIFIC